ncbi:exo-alpha-sialidase [Rhabdobacter roseus]|uniref:Alpha-L-fucosidase n=1 Tax=Rhabdobacter roseus TaxID=1655419 RepID=A0A840TT78_9BACT|nr:sialidase family protein [Rhabdobacter roseus]MBB5287161.1 alpha-L-fucosidase [Rhabdobacter roseus]
MAQPKVSVVERKFIYTEPPTPECHASTIVEVTPGKLMAAWFGGTHEKNPDVCIWLSTQEKGVWSKPVMMADGVVGDKRYPTWNPVLFKAREGKLFLFYKVGPSPETWWGMVRTSDNNGKTWSQPERLPDGILGPIKNKPVQLTDGTLLAPSSTESKKNGWKAHVERSRDLGKTWELMPVDPTTELDVIQGSILFYPNNRLQMLCRSKQDRVVEVWSEDGGKTWGTLQKLSLLNPNSGTDAVTLSNGWQLLVYNPTTRGKQWDNGRQKLRVALSKDGKEWTDAVVLEDQERGEFSYPAVIQSKDGRVHITYTSERKKVQYVALDIKN